MPFDGSFRVSDSPTAPPSGTPSKAALERRLEELSKEFDSLQNVLHADARRALLLVFQGMDAAGKDRTIRAVLSGLNPLGFEVHSFKAPSAEELKHEFLWRYRTRMPRPGRIGVFNRSHYEPVLVERVHPEVLAPGFRASAALWRARFAAIRRFERQLADSGTVVLKFWLNVSPQVQRHRLLARLDVPDKNWKFNAADIRERRRLPDYMNAYEAALNATSRPWAPWYAIPADSKPFMRLQVMEIIIATLRTLRLRYPTISRTRLAALRRMLERDRQVR